VIRDIGDLTTLRTIVTDATGTPVNTPTVTCLVTKPDGTTATPGVTNTGSNGLYTASVTPDQAGTWLYAFTASGTVVAVQADQFTVVTAGRVLVASMEEFKAQLRRADTTDDLMLRSYLVSATDVAEWAIGGPMAPTTFTELTMIRSWWVAPKYRPLISVTSITPELGGVLDSSAYVVDTNRNGIRVRWGALAGWYTLVYRAGLSIIPERVKLGGLIIAQHLWQVENGGGGLPFPGANDTQYVPMGFAVPSRALELLGAGSLVPGIA
jgi:hypothetical protein